MNKKKIFAVCRGAAFALVCIAVFVFAGKINPDLFTPSGTQADKEKGKEEDSRIFARGSSGGTVAKEEIERAEQFYITAGYEPEAAREKAVEYMLEREALYRQAVAEGYGADDGEVREYIAELKETLESAAGADESGRKLVEDAMGEFESEEEYWEYEFQVYQKNLPIEKYLNALEEAFLEQHINDLENGLITEEDVKGQITFQEYLETLKDELVKKEAFEVFE